MKEGEFKKRIDAVKWHHDFDMGGEGYSITEEDLTEMLEEAKKEFPDVIEPFPTVQGALLYGKRVKEWREGWFGK